MLAYAEHERDHVTISRSRKRVRFHWTSRHRRFGPGIEGSARIFAEEMGASDAEEDVSENNARRKAETGMYIRRLSERIKTERIADEFSFQSVSHRESVDPFALFCPDDA